MGVGGADGGEEEGEDDGGGAVGEESDEALEAEEFGVSA